MLGLNPIITKALGYTRVSNRVSVELANDAPYGRLCSYFFADVTHPDQLPSPLSQSALQNPDGREFRRWVAANGGVPIGTSWIEVSMQNSYDATVLLVGARLEPQTMGHRSGISVSNQSGGPIEGFRMDASLRTGEIVCHSHDSNLIARELIPIKFRIEKGKSELFNIFTTDDRAVRHRLAAEIRFCR